MELIDRYVETVGAKITAPRRKEIEAELKAAILDALEARNATPESEADVVAVLAEFGPPDAVAAEYEPSRRYLIGPELYPEFLLGLRVALTALVIGCTVTFAVSVISGGFTNFQAGNLLIDAIRLGLYAAVVGVVMMVAVFSWMQRTNRRFPKHLSARPKPWSPGALRASRAEPMSRAGALFGLVVSAIVLMILGSIGGAARETLATAPAEWRSTLQDGVIMSVLLLQGGMVVSVIAHAVALIRGGWDIGTRVARLIADLIAVGVFARAAIMLHLERQQMVSSGTVTAQQADWLIYTAFAVTLVIAAVAAADCWKLLRRSRPATKSAVAVLA